MSKVTSGEAFKIPTRLLLVSTFRVFVSTVTSPDTVSPVKVPTLVIAVCAAVESVPAKAFAVTVPDTFKLLRVPTEVIFVCAAVAKVAFKAPLTVRLERVPTEVIFVCAAVLIVP